jgi:hypothetical protein
MTKAAQVAMPHGPKRWYSRTALARRTATTPPIRPDNDPPSAQATDVAGSSAMTAQHIDESGSKMSRRQAAGRRHYYHSRSVAMRERRKRVLARGRDAWNDEDQHPASAAVIVDVIANGIGTGSEVLLGDAASRSVPSHMHTAAKPSHSNTIRRL